MGAEGSATGFKANEKNLYKTYSSLVKALREAGLESSQIILCYDFSSSNDDSGAQTYHANMHNVQALKETPYEKVTKLMTFLVKEFDEDQKIPCYIFGSDGTEDKCVAPLIPGAKDAYITGMENVIKAYHDNAMEIVQSGPTTMAPMIKEAIRLCQETKEYHILIIITDGGISSPELDGKAVVEASNYPLSIVTVGVGDGPFETLDTFDNALKQRRFDNFNFFNFTEMEKKLERTENVDETIAVNMLQEIPAQF